MTISTEDLPSSPVSWATVVQRVAIGAGAALLVGAGSMIIGDNTKVQLHEQRLSKLESSLEKLPEIDRNVLVLSGKVDVLNQKLDDARDARLVAKAK